MRTIFASLTTLALLLSVLAMPTSANHQWPVDVRSGVVGYDWKFTNGDHKSRLSCGVFGPNGENFCARDVGGNFGGGDQWPSGANIVFDASAGVEGVVAKVALNCHEDYPHDKYIDVELWLNGEFYGVVAYVHVTNPQVTQGQRIPVGTVLGTLQSQSSPCWGAVHIHFERSSMGNWTNAPIGQRNSYSLPVLTYPSGISSIQKAQLEQKAQEEK